MSNLTRGVLTSSLLQRDVSYSLIIPDGYSTSARRYPTLYLLHGLFGSFENWIDLTNLSEHARGHDLIIVMPDGADGWYTDSSNGGYYESYAYKFFRRGVVLHSGALV